MTQEQFKTALEALNIPVAYHHQKAGTRVPFLNYTWHVNSALKADDKVYTKKVETTIELVCSSKKELNTLSEQLEAILEDIAPWISDETYSDTEQIYINTYTMEV